MNLTVGDVFTPVRVASIIAVSSLVLIFVVCPPV